MVERRESGNEGRESARSSKPDPSPAQIHHDDRIERIKDLLQVFIKQAESLSRSYRARPRISLREEVRRFEVELIRHALVLTGGHQRRAARMLGVKVTTLNEKIKRYRIQPSRLSLAGDPGAPDR